jgi:hypothetical protein
MVKSKPNRPLNRLINHFNKDAPISDTQHLTISLSVFDRSFERIGGLGVRRDHESVGKVLVDVLADEGVHVMVALGNRRDDLL